MLTAPTGPEAPEAIIADGNRVFGLEVRGFDHIPPAERNMTLASVGPMWLGANINMFSVSIGCVAISLGLNLWQALLACIAGNLPYLYLGLASVGAVRAGLPVSTLSRSVYGVTGNRAHAFLCWACSVCFEIFNAVFGSLAWLSLLTLMGLDNRGIWPKLSAVAIQIVLGGGVAIFGHATMVQVQKVFAVALGGVFLLALAFTLPQAHWTSAAHGLNGLALAAAFMTAGGVIASQPISYLFNGPDWVRYLPESTSGPRLFHTVFWWTFLPSLVLCGGGALWASLGDMSDPVAGVRHLLPPWLYLIFVGSVILGSVLNNASTIYSSGLCLQAMGVSLSRWAATVLDLGICTAAVLYILFVQDVSTFLNAFVGLLVAWSGPYAGVWMMDGVLRRWRYDLAAIHPVAGLRTRHNASRAWLAYAIGMIVALLTMRSPQFQGPINAMLGGMDLSWVLGLVAAAGAYALLWRSLPSHSRGEGPGIG